VRWLRTFARNWRESAPYVPAMWTGFGGRVEWRWHRLPFPARVVRTFRQTRRAEAIARAAHRDEVKLPRLRFSLRATLQGAAFELGRGVGAGYDVLGRQQLEKELEAARAHARVHEDQWRLTNEDLRRSRVCQRQAEEYALELKAELVKEGAGAAVEVPGESFWRVAPRSGRRRWFSWR
jgi:hypothetical protein